MIKAVWISIAMTAATSILPPLAMPSSDNSASVAHPVWNPAKGRYETRYFIHHFNSSLTRITPILLTDDPASLTSGVGDPAVVPNANAATALPIDFIGYAPPDAPQSDGADTVFLRLDATHFRRWTEFRRPHAGADDPPESLWVGLSARDRSRLRDPRQARAQLRSLIRATIRCLHINATAASDPSVRNIDVRIDGVAGFSALGGSFAASVPAVDSAVETFAIHGDSLDVLVSAVVPDFNVDGVEYHIADDSFLYRIGTAAVELPLRLPMNPPNGIVQVKFEGNRIGSLATDTVSVTLDCSKGVVWLNEMVREALKWDRERTPTAADSTQWREVQLAEIDSYVDALLQGLRVNAARTDPRIRFLRVRVIGREFQRFEGVHPVANPRKHHG